MSVYTNIPHSSGFEIEKGNLRYLLKRDLREKKKYGGKTHVILREDCEMTMMMKSIAPFFGGILTCHKAFAFLCTNTYVHNIFLTYLQIFYFFDKSEHKAVKEKSANSVK